MQGSATMHPSPVQRLSPCGIRPQFPHLDAWMRGVSVDIRISDKELVFFPTEISAKESNMYIQGCLPLDSLPENESMPRVRDFGALAP
jgi:hypothetical protein